MKMNKIKKRCSVRLWFFKGSIKREEEGIECMSMGCILLTISSYIITSVLLINNWPKSKGFAIRQYHNWIKMYKKEL